MGKDTVFANGRSVATLGTDHMARNLVPTPDWCKVPKPGTPAMPFPNYVFSTELKAGKPGKTLYAGKEVWTAIGELGPTSLDPHDGILGGVTSGTYLGRAKPLTYSLDVLVENQGVVRLRDFTTQNDENTVGIVDMRANLAAFLAEFWGMWGAYAPAPEDTGDAPDPNEDGRPPEPEDDGTGEGEGEGGEDDNEVVTDCELDKEEIWCAHNGRRRLVDGSTGTKLQVVPKGAAASESIKYSCTVAEVCPGGGHPSWTLSGAASETQVSKQGSFSIPNPGSSQKQTGFAAIPLLADTWMTEPRKYVLTAAACGGTYKFQVEAYPGTEFDIGDLLPPAVRSAMEGIKGTLQGTAGGGTPVQLEIEILKGELGIQAGWNEEEEDGNKWRAFFKFVASASYNPVLSLDFKFSILPPFMIPIRAALARVSCDINLFWFIKGSVGLQGTLGRSGWNTWVGAEIKGTLTLEVGVGANITLGPMLSGEVRGSAGASYDLGFTADSSSLKFFYGPLTIGMVKATIELSSTFGLVKGGLYALSKLINAQWDGPVIMSGEGKMKVEYVVFQGFTPLLKQEKLLAGKG